MKEFKTPTIEVVLDKKWDKEVLTYFIDEKDQEYDFGYDRIASLHPSIASIRGKSDEEKLAIVTPYVEDYYAEHQQDIVGAKQEMANIWKSIAVEYLIEIEKIFGALDFYKPTKITAALSIARAGVIGEDNASFQIWYKTTKEPAEVRRHFAHEILHFFYYAYLEEKGLSALKKDWDKAEIFNVVILGLPQFVSLIGKPDLGYKQHEKHFPYYRNLWAESEDLDDYLLRSERVSGDAIIYS
ncbi:MAG: hypothetical protein NUV90_00480 [Candidatus Parcubacteria bacterium]|nr:hypothetical protein [Candidatus Parcubacteria bacterium]